MMSSNMMKCVAVLSVLANISAARDFTVTKTITAVSIRTSTVTSVKTVGCSATTPVSSVAPSTTYPSVATCSNAGLNYAIYTNPFQVDSGNKATTNYTSFSPEYFKSQTPYAVDTTTTLGFVNAACGSTDSTGNCRYDANTTLYATNTKTLQIAVNHHGYFFAPQSGSYTFKTPASDDITILWFGATAYSGWTRANADIVQTYVRTQDNSITITKTLVAGTYYPFRIVYGNGIQVARFSFSVTAPDGSTVVNSDISQANQYLVQYPCDGSSPQFAAFGAES